LAAGVNESNDLVGLHRLSMDVQHADCDALCRPGVRYPIAPRFVELSDSQGLVRGREGFGFRLHNP
jgi:hypothetical protein